jgi:hypothetical protein
VKKPQLIGLSPFLSSDAFGHHLPYHSRAFQLLSEIGETKYIGKRGNLNSESWYLAKFPKEMTRPRPLITQGKFDSILNTTKADKNSLFFVYEGSIYWAILAMRYMQNHNNTAFIINLFNSKITTLRLTGKFRVVWITLYKFILKQSNGRMTYSADNFKYFETLRKILGEANLLYLPLFPSFKSGRQEKLDRNSNILISVRGPKGKRFLSQLAPYIKYDARIVVHGLSKEYLLDIGLPLAQVSGHIPNFEEYVKSCLKVSKSILFYETGKYSYQSSGRLIDFHELRIPTLAPEGSAHINEFQNCKLIQAFDYQQVTAVVKFIQNELNQPNPDCNCQPREEQFRKAILKEIEKKNEKVYCEEFNWYTKILSKSIKLSIDGLSFATLQGRLTFENFRDHIRQHFRTNFP